MNNIKEPSIGSITLKKKESGNKMNLLFKKEDLTTRHVVELRNGEMCFIGERINDGLVFYGKEQFGGCYGKTSLAFMSKNLEEFTSCNYDIMKIKEFNTSSEAISTVLNGLHIHNWDWIREEKTPFEIKIEELEKDAKEIQRKIEELKKISEEE